jgi:uncharacterized membrane protein (UPF0127 family)
VHTFWMRFPIDVAFVAMPMNPDGGATRVVEVHHALLPRRYAAAGRHTRAPGVRVAALELPGGAAERLWIKPGETLELHIGAERDVRTPEPGPDAETRRWR